MIKSDSTTYFTKKELECKCCGKCDLETDFKDRVLDLRIAFGQSMESNSCFRCEDHNKDVGGSLRSFHLKGMAMDVKCPNSEYKARLARVALNKGFTVGVYSKFLHIDIRETQILFKGSY